MIGYVELFIGIVGSALSLCSGFWLMISSLKTRISLLEQSNRFFEHRFKESIGDIDKLTTEIQQIHKMLGSMEASMKLLIKLSGNDNG